MKIRAATKFDIPVVCRLLTNYKNNCPIDSLQNATEDRAAIILQHIILGAGIALVAERDNKIQGMMLAMIDSNVWDPKCLVLKELAYWVEPAARGTTAGFRLLHKYNELAKQLHATGRITLWTISKMTSSPDLNYKKLGYTKIEETWSQGA